MVLFTLISFLSLLVVFGAIHWVLVRSVFGPSDIIYAGLYVLVGSYLSYRGFTYLRRTVSTQPEELLHLAGELYKAVKPTLRYAFVMTVTLILLASTGRHTWIDSHIYLPKINYPPYLLDILFLPLTTGASFTYPMAIHLEHRLGIYWAAAVLNQLPTLLQLGVIYFLANVVVRRKQRR